MAVWCLYRLTSGGYDEAALRKGLSVEELTVALYELAPLVFGLRGYEDQYPDKNTVSCLLSGHSGPVRKGWLYRNNYRVCLTPEGLEVGRRVDERLSGRQAS